MQGAGWASVLPGVSRKEEVTIYVLVQHVDTGESNIYGLYSNFTRAQHAYEQMHRGYDYERWQVVGVRMDNDPRLVQSVVNW